MFQTSLFKTFARQAACIVLLGAVLVPLSACDLSKNHLKADRSSDMEVQDYRDALAPRLPDIEDKADEAGIPSLKPYMATPSDKLKPMPLVSISVNQGVPLRDVLYELAEQADYDIELDPRIKGSVIFSARNRPFDQVIDKLSESAGLRYKFDDDSVKVELDTPYHEIYKINYLNYVRKNLSSISNDVSVVTGEGASDTGSRFRAESSSDSDFWGEINTNLTQLISTNRAVSTLTTARDPRVTTVTETAAPVEPVVLSANGEIAQAGTTPDGARVQQPQAVLRVDTLGSDGTGADGSTGAEVDGAPAADIFAGRFSINKQAGMISVYATERLHKKVANYLEVLQKSVASQVLIEAKVLEVTLNDEFAAGIDWSALNLFGKRFGIGADSKGTVLPTFDPVSTSRVGLVTSYVGNSGNLNVAVEAMSRFGTVRSLASPRLTVLNNQSAVLNVAKNIVFFEIDVDRTQGQDGNPDTVTYDSTARTVPEGVLINVMPSIDTDSKTISMAIRPTISRVDSFVNDPAVSIESNGNVQSPFPVMNIQEFDSVIKMNNGQPIVMGGLIQDRAASTQTGVPVLSEVPMLGGLFRNQNDKIVKTELVVFLKATIVEGNNSIHQTDKDLYRTFSQDRRPFDM